MVKISIISGFLGAGKTTFIKKLLEEKYFGFAPVLIENDYGYLGIDSLIMENTGVQVCEMNSGCICCSLTGNFILALEELIRQQNPEHIIIEPSGVGKLSEILEALNDLEIPFEKYLVLTIVDARRFYYNNQYVSEYFWDQITNADAVVLSKTNQMSGKELSALCSTIHNKNADMEVICVPWSTDYHPALKHMLPAGMRSRINTQNARTAISPFSFSGIHQRRADIFESWSTETCIEYSDQRLHEIINALELKKYGAIVRAKGVLNNPQGPILLDYIPGEGRLSSVDMEESGRMLVIGMNLNRPALERLFLT